MRYSPEKKVFYLQNKSSLRWPYRIRRWRNCTAGRSSVRTCCPRTPGRTPVPSDRADTRPRRRPGRRAPPAATSAAASFFSPEISTLWWVGYKSWPSIAEHSQPPNAGAGPRWCGERASDEDAGVAQQKLGGESVRRSPPPPPPSCTLADNYFILSPLVNCPTRGGSLSRARKFSLLGFFGILMTNFKWIII